MTLLLVAFLNVGAKFYLESHPTTVAYTLVQEKWKLLRQQKEPADIVVLGDSAAAFCLDPEYLSEKTGLKVLNLATAGHILALNDAWMLNEYVRLVGKPQVVISIRFFPYWELESPSAHLLSCVPLPWEFWQVLRPGISLPGQQTWDLFLGRYFPLYSKSLTLQKLFRVWHHSPEITKVKKDGGLELDLPPVADFSAGKLFSQRLKSPVPFSISELNRFSLDALQSTCGKNGITLILANPPAYQGDTEQKYYASYLESLDQSLQAFASFYPHVLFFRAEPLVLGEEEMIDAIHARPSGARTYTERFYQQLKRASDGK